MLQVSFAYDFLIAFSHLQKTVKNQSFLLRSEIESGVSVLGCCVNFSILFTSVQLINLNVKLLSLIFRTILFYSYNVHCLFRNFVCLLFSRIFSELLRKITSKHVYPALWASFVETDVSLYNAILVV